jgi:hypothetical protein
MQTKEALEFALTASDNAVTTEIDKMSDDPTKFPTPNGGCHPLWVAGHLTVVEGSIPAVLYGEDNPVGKWYALFGETPNQWTIPRHTRPSLRFEKSTPSCARRTWNSWHRSVKMIWTSQQNHHRGDENMSSPPSGAAF